MAEVFVISDTHLGHANIIKFSKADGSPLRPFLSLTDMHNTIIERWCKTVRPQDKVYHLGDVAFKLEALDLIASLPGHKRLVMGNHDLFQTPVYLKYFEKLHGASQINGVWLTHVPMHPESVESPRVKVNIHGHLHANKISHPKYYNACVECNDYTPVSIDEIVKGL